jgi:hypothetical protein
MQSNLGPLRIAEDYQPNPSANEILLVTDVFVGAQQNVVAAIFGPLDEFAVFQLVPANLPGEGNFVANQAARNRLRSAIIEQNLHARTQEL